MPARAKPEEGRHLAVDNPGSGTDSEARLRELVGLYRGTDGDQASDDDNLRRLVEKDQARRLRQAWKAHVADLRAEVATINSALDSTGVCLEPHVMEPGPGVSYLACVEVRIGGDPPAPRPSAFVALTRRSEARLQIRIPGCVRHETRYVALAEIAAETWKDLLFELLEANWAWSQARE